MKILLISYEDYEYDGRIRALISVFSQIGELTCFLGGGPKEPWITICKSNYPVFIKKSIAFAKKMGTIDVLVLDNRKATIPGLVIKKLVHPKIVIQDCREFYRLNEVKHLSGKIGCIFEHMMIKRADVIIAANEERSDLMVKEYGLKNRPLTYENLRKLTYESKDSQARAKKKIDRILGEDDCIRIISSSGCDINRTNDVLVRNLLKINSKVKLFLVGSNSEHDERVIKSIAENDQKNNVIITGRLNQSELKYLISQCHIGIVNYGQYDTNNKYCASGKLYEFVYEGIPVVTTTNPPLKRLCDDYGIGIADDEYCNGINSVVKDYEKYKVNTVKFANSHTVEENDSKLIGEIRECFKNKSIRMRKEKKC